VESYREHLKLKLHLNSGTELVQHAIQWVMSETGVSGVTKSSETVSQP
jgi:hypothetical protein